MDKTKKIFLYIIIDVLSIAVSWILAVLMQNVSIGVIFSKYYLYFIIGIALNISASFAVGLYANIWKYAGLVEGIKLLAVGTIVAVWNVIVAILVPEFNIAWALLVSMLYVAFLIITRYSYRLYGYLMNRQRKVEKHGKERVLIIGGGASGSVLIKEMQNSDKLNMLPVCILDDDLRKKGLSINGIKIVGTTDEVEFYAKKYNVSQIIIALPSASKKDISRIAKLCQQTDCKVRIVPGVYQFADGELSISSTLKDVSIQDLLGREQVKVNLDEIMGYIKGKRVLVTGGGGSIGSELCRQIAKHEVGELIIVDIYENNAYDIQQELLRHYPDLNLKVLIASVRDSRKINNIFAKYKPQIVFHAAAHKHVPLMEVSPNEAVKNNVSGTYKVADAAGRNGVEKFILISTDKAVNPTNIMGATKRICEMIIQTMNKVYKETNYVAVRFGNVLGSNGSVIPLFKKQIEEGGPVTVTDKDIVRYFMTIPEAVSLVLQAGAYAKGGEIFVLDMGEPVKIYDLAINMIRLSGLEPFTDIDIKITGLRPGEKLYEERLMAEEGMKKTANEMISIGKPLEIDEKNLFKKIQELYIEAYNETPRMKELVHELVPTYKIDTKNVANEA